MTAIVPPSLPDPDGFRAMALYYATADAYGRGNASPKALHDAEVGALQAVLAYVQTYLQEGIAWAVEHGENGAPS